MRENDSRRWSIGLKFVQWQINISHHETTGVSPFKVTFGQDPQVGLGTSILPSAALCNISTEEDLETYLETKKAEAETGAQAEAETGAQAEAETGAQAEANTGAQVEAKTGAQVEAETGAQAEAEAGAQAGAEAGVQAEAETGAQAETEIVAQAEADTGIDAAATVFQKIRDSANQGQSKAALKMTRRGKHQLKPLSIGQCATLRVPDVDRGPTDPKNLLVVILKDEGGLYTVGCREGILKPKFTVADLSAIQQPLIKFEEVPNVNLSIRTATAKATGGQGYTKCQCTTPCTSGRCSCLRKEIKCNSRCHGSSSCTLWSKVV